MTRTHDRGITQPEGMIRIRDILDNCRYARRGIPLGGPVDFWITPYINDEGNIIVEVKVWGELEPPDIKSPEAILEAAALALLPLCMKVIQLVDAVQEPGVQDVKKAPRRRTPRCRAG